MKKKAFLICLLCSFLFLESCSFTNNEKNISFSEAENNEETGYVREEAGFFDSADTAVVTSIDLTEGMITFHNFQLGKNYTLKYDGATQIFDKYGNGIAMSQINAGDITDVTFYKLAKRLNSISLSQNAWTYSDLKKFEIGSNQKSFHIGENEFALHKNAVVISDDSQGEIAEINSNDTLTVKGIDHEIYSIIIDKGHGYLRLVNDEYFIGGWIEIGQELIQPVTEDMLLVVPEGTYQVLLTNTGIETTREVTIAQNGEIGLDVGDVTPTEKKFGQILFSIEPSETVLYLDGVIADYSKPVLLEYGIHQMIAKAAGYDTLSQYIKVGQEFANLNIEMEVSPGETDENTDSVSENNVSANTVTSNNTVSASSDENYKIYVEAPEGAEIYLDSNYVGIAPTSFLKSAGTHVITLRKSGYVTKSYTLQVDSASKDVTYSFSALVNEY